MQKSINELLEAILQKVKDLENKIVSQERGIELYMSKSSMTPDQIEILISYIKSLTMVFVDYTI